MTLELQYKSEDSWIECFQLDAEKTNIAIPSVAYLGLSAETGELSDNHDIISLKTQNLYSISGSPPPTNRGSSSSNRDRGNAKNSKKQDSKSSSGGGGGWLWFLFKVVLFFAAIAGGYVGWTAYRARQRYSRF